MSRRLEIIDLFFRISSLLLGSFAKETCNFKDSTNRSHPIATKTSHTGIPTNFCTLTLAQNQNSPKRASRYGKKLRLCKIQIVQVARHVQVLRKREGKGERVRERKEERKREREREKQRKRARERERERKKKKERDGERARE